MEIYMNMTEEEMKDFLNYRQEKKNRAAAKDRLRELAKKALWAIGMDEEDHVAVIDRDHAEELLEMAAEYAE